MPRASRTVSLAGMRLDSMTEPELLDHVFSALAHGRGGWLITANLDFLRRYAKEPDHRPLYDQADLRVADGMPLVWAARVMGRPLPERLAGSSMLTSFAARAAWEGRSVYFLGGNEGAAEGARRKLEARLPALRVLGTSSPWVKSPPRDEEVEAIRAQIGEPPDLLFVGLGSPKQEHLIAALRPHFPRTWMMGVGISFSFLAGDVARAPEWMQRTGVEWFHRFLQEPTRLGGRYFRDDLPFAAELMAAAVLRRLGRP